GTVVDAIVYPYGDDERSREVKRRSNSGSGKLVVLAGRYEQRKSGRIRIVGVYHHKVRKFKGHALFFTRAERKLANDHGRIIRITHLDLEIERCALIDAIANSKTNVKRTVEIGYRSDCGP